MSGIPTDKNLYSDFRTEWIDSANQAADQAQAAKQTAKQIIATAQRLNRPGTVKYYYSEEMRSFTCVEFLKLRELFDLFDGLIYCNPNDWDDQIFQIVYADGSSLYIDDTSDIIKFPRRNIISMIYSHAEGYCVYGNFHMDELGGITADDELSIDPNIIEFSEDEYKIYLQNRKINQQIHGGYTHTDIPKNLAPIDHDISDIYPSACIKSPILHSLENAIVKNYQSRGSSQKSVHFSTGNDEWATPDELYQALDEEFHFTLDPCATDANHKCEKYYTIADDGLSQSWAGETVFCNPPYSRGNQSRWIKKCYDESRAHGITVVLLIPARTDTKSFHEYILDKSEIRFIRGRIKFIHGDCKNPAPFPSMIVIYRAQPL